MHTHTHARTHTQKQQRRETCVESAVSHPRPLISLSSLPLTLPQLILTTYEWDFGKGKWFETNPAKYVRKFWGLDRGQRARAWKQLGTFQRLEILKIGGGTQEQCPLDAWEVRSFFPPGENALANLRELVLWHVSGIDDEGMCFLCSHGLGRNLTRLELVGALFSFSLSSFIPSFVFRSSLSLRRSERKREGRERNGTFIPCSMSRYAPLSGLGKDFTDVGLHALAGQGCGSRLSCLFLAGVLMLVFILPRHFSDDGDDDLFRIFFSSFWQSPATQSSRMGSRTTACAHLLAVVAGKT